jgi:hypothetical protein
MDGLIGLASHFEAGGPEDFTGYTEEQMKPEQRRSYDMACLAAEWINAMAAWRGMQAAKRGKGRAS